MVRYEGPRPDELSPSEVAHLRHRDRKRETPMVVDNAAAKRIAIALREQAHAKAEQKPATKKPAGP